MLVGVLHPVKGISISNSSSEKKNPRTVFPDEGTREVNSVANILGPWSKRVNYSIKSIDNVMVSKRTEKKFATEKLQWKVYMCAHMHARSSNCQLNDAKHMDYFVATTLFRDAPRFVSDDSKRSRASRTRPDPLGTGKIIIHPELWWHKFLAGWEKCQCLFDPYNLSYRSLELDRFSYIYIVVRKCILPKEDIDLSLSSLEEIRGKRFHSTLLLFACF